ncbi:MAG TPA: hypothetical protein PKK40_01720 [Marmoricola sp.]|nr:hypothetical protein [Marmoricola sp.]
MSRTCDAGAAGRLGGVRRSAVGLGEVGITCVGSGSPWPVGAGGRRFSPYSQVKSGSDSGGMGRTLPVGTELGASKRM